MTLEVLQSLIYRWPGGEIRLKAGERVDLPEERAKRLLARGGGRIRELSSIPGHLEDLLQPGAEVSWVSPLFGSCKGIVAASPEAGWFVIQGHSVTGDPALIHTEWHVRVHTGS